MKYRRIDKDTVQCIVSGADMEKHGLTLTDIFERSEKAETFFRNIIEEAHDTVGYEFEASGNVAMQITPIHDDGMIVTITQNTAGTVKSFLEHMKDVCDAIASGRLTAEGYGGIGGFESPEPQTTSIDEEQPKDIRIFEFGSMENVLRFAEDGFIAGQVKSYLGKADGKYYLVVIKNRSSWKNFNKLSAKAFDFANVVVDVKNKLIYLGEHGEGLIESGAIQKLSKICHGRS